MSFCCTCNKSKPLARSVRASRTWPLLFCFIITQGSCSATMRTAQHACSFSNRPVLSLTQVLCNCRFLCLGSSFSLEAGCFSCFRVQLKWPLLGEALTGQSPFPGVTRRHINLFTEIILLICLLLDCVLSLNAKIKCLSP